MGRYYVLRHAAQENGTVSTVGRLGRQGARQRGQQRQGYSRSTEAGEEEDRGVGGQGADLYQLRRTSAGTVWITSTSPIGNRLAYRDSEPTNLCPSRVDQHVAIGMPTKAVQPPGSRTTHAQRHIHK